MKSAKLKSGKKETSLRGRRKGIYKRGEGEPGQTEPEGADGGSGVSARTGSNLLMIHRD